MNFGNLAIQMPFSSLGTKTKMDIPESMLQEIDVETCTNMHKVHIKEFDSKKKRWMRWRQDFETSMKGAKIDLKWWVAVLPMYLNDLAHDVYRVTHVKVTVFDNA